MLSSQNLRIVDKYSVSPPTTYIGAQFKEVLTQPNVTYRQANLTVACKDPLSPVRSPSNYDVSQLRSRHVLTHQRARSRIHMCST